MYGGEGSSPVAPATFRATKPQSFLMIGAFVRLVKVGRWNKKGTLQVKAAIEDFTDRFNLYRPNDAIAEVIGFPDAKGVD